MTRILTSVTEVKIRVMPPSFLPFQFSERGRETI